MARSHGSRARTLLALGGILAILGAGGCVGPPPVVPVPAWVPDRIEERLNHKNDNRTPVMPPIPTGYTPKCEDPPDPQTINRALPRVARGLPGIYEEFRDDIDYSIEKLVDHIDPPRFYPLIGMAQLHHCHWKISVFYTETISVGFPIPYRTVRRRQEVVYIDQDHLHPYVQGQEAQREIGRAFMGPLP